MARGKVNGEFGSAPGKTSKIRQKLDKVKKSSSKKKSKSRSKSKRRSRSNDASEGTAPWPTKMSIDMDVDMDEEVEGVAAYDSNSGGPYEDLDLNIEVDKNCYSPSDYESQIARCKERIAEGVLIYVFEEKLKNLEARVKKRDSLMAKWPSHSHAIAERLEFFDALRNFLVKDGDKNEVISTIEAIAQAYMWKKLDWVPGYVTYWSYGKQLTGLREFDWDEFLSWNFAYKGSKGFWVEGVPVSLNLILPPERRGVPDPSTTLDPNRPPPLKDATDRQISVVPRDPVPFNLPYAGEQPPVPSSPIKGIAHSEWPRERWTRHWIWDYNIFWMIDDTGADLCTITESDVTHLVTKTTEYFARQTNDVNFEVPYESRIESVAPPLLGYIRVRFANDEMGFQPIRAMEINLLGQDPSESNKGAFMLKHWDIIEVAIAPDPKSPEHEPTRLLGPWLRHRFYTATSPDGSGRLYIFKKKRRFMEVPHANVGDSGLLPGVGVRQNVPAEELHQNLPVGR
ncbi:hypothetical protein N7540_008910 [Penicillium herquei]|nr:hypothetical protein N7540_008910 [Penicillium herquei]